MSKYKFISWNVNGIRAVDKKEALKWVDEANIDLLGIQETKSTKEQIPNSIFQKEYQTVFASESAIKGRSGTVITSYSIHYTKLYDNSFIKDFKA